MIMIDKALQKLEEKEQPIRIGLVGAGFAGRGFAMQVITGMIGMRLVAISNRTLSQAKLAYNDAGIQKIKKVSSSSELTEAINNNIYSITDNPQLLCNNPNIDVIVEATGEVEFGAQVIMDAITNNKHVVLINAELDATLGPILKDYADKKGVIYTQADGDQPGVLMNLYRYVKTIGFKPVMVGNIKSLIDNYRTPETQKKWAEEHFQRPKMVTSFADGTKIAMEMATIANATGFPVSKRGMEGPSCKHVDEAYKLFDQQKLLTTGLTDYILGAEPSFGVFVLGYSTHPIKQRYMQVYKMGNGPFYTFYTPYHLSPLEAPLSVARAVLFKDVALAPFKGMVTEVVAISKKDMKAGEVLDGIGGFTCYGVLENYPIARNENLLPMGLTDGCVLLRDISKDEPITYSDVSLPAGRLCDKLRQEQDKKYTV